MGKKSPSRILKGIWRRTGHRWIRRVEFLIMSRSLSEPNLPRPQGRDSAMGEGDDFYMDSATNEMIDELKGQFPAKKLKVFRDLANNPDVDFMLRIRSDGRCPGYLMHAFKPVPDAEYGFTIPIIPGKEVFQFDGWVHPDFRGYLVAIIGTNYALDRRRSSGHQSIVNAVRCKDRTSMKFHLRFGFKPIGKITHYRVGKFRWNKVQMDDRN